MLRIAALFIFSSSLSFAAETFPFLEHKDSCHKKDQAACNSSAHCTWCTSNLGAPTLCYGTSCHKVGHCYCNEAAEQFSARYFTCDAHDIEPTPEPQPAPATDDDGASPSPEPEPAPVPDDSGDGASDDENDENSKSADVCDQHNADGVGCMADPLCTWCESTGLVPDKPECILRTDAPWVPTKFFKCAKKDVPSFNNHDNKVSGSLNCAKFQSNDDCNSDSECSWCVKTSPLGKKKMCVKGGEAVSTYIPLGFKCNNLD